MDFVTGIVFLPLILLCLAFVSGSVLAYRGEQSWKTRLMIIGSGCQSVGFLTYFAGGVLMYSMFRGGSMSNAYSIFSIVMMVAGLLILVGMVVFAIAFVAYCARAGAAGKRAGELEEMLGHMQQRLAEVDRIQ